MKAIDLGDNILYCEVEEKEDLFIILKHHLINL
jgi:hypothetical protein